MASESQENVKGLKKVWGWVKGCFEKMVNVVTGFAKEAKKLGEEDPRRVVHSFKVGLAITLVSLFYYFDFSYEGFGVNAMWAVMTVVVVFEFSVGATLGKGVNRAIATLLGGALGVGAHRLASFTGEKIECIMLGMSVLLIAAATTFIRFFPKLKARYDYGLLIFILTFSLISVSGYRDDEVLDMAHRRLSTILIGGSVTVFISIFICPIWAGEDLHKSLLLTLKSLRLSWKVKSCNNEILIYYPLSCYMNAKSSMSTNLTGFGREYFRVENDKNQENKASLDEYKSVLNSKGSEDSLVNFAKWEPRHGKFRYRQPWDQYLKVGSLTRECAYKIDALNGYLKSDVQTPIEIRSKIQETCTKMSSECSVALRELAVGIKTMTCSLSADPHLLNAKTAAKKLKSLLKTNLWPETDLLEIVPAVTVVSLLIEIVSCTVKITDAVHELASLSKFKIPDPQMIKQISLDKTPRTPSLEASHNFNIIVE
ncbi:Aluminum-activated malate transporter 2 [Sesamum angolense]|uniref:Aluminum-activated malate transporter 2 n=1 Tax=Sesamum angolense TaxID=2727404 RepID=A0AAE1XBY6_9LAMI|nr:Aluminum-activated malate transporter 2 [Sesamum angolense]